VPPEETISVPLEETVYEPVDQSREEELGEIVGREMEIMYSGRAALETMMEIEEADKKKRRWWRRSKR